MNRYCYWLLNENDRKIYEQLSNGITNLSNCIRTDTISKERLSYIIRSVLTDNPGYFWFEGRISVRKEGKGITVTPHYLYSASEIKSAEHQIDIILQKFSLYQTETKYDKAKVAYDWLTENVCYSIGNGGQNIYNAFIERKAVCKGLSKAYQFLLLKLGVFSTLVDGTIDGVARHIWNIVEIDGNFYNVDISMGYSAFDFLFYDPKHSDKYRMFLKSDAEMTHICKQSNLGQMPRIICNQSYKRG